MDVVVSLVEVPNHLGEVLVQQLLVRVQLLIRHQLLDLVLVRLRLVLHDRHCVHMLLPKEDDIKSGLFELLECNLVG